MINYEDILNTVAEKGNMGGISTEIYFAPRADFQTLAEKPSEDDAVRDFDDMNMLSVGSDTLYAGKKLYKIYSTAEKGSLVAARQGEADGISHKVTLSLFTPGLDSKSLSMLMIPNQSWIFYVKTGSKMFRLGNDAFPAKLAGDGEVGTGDATATIKGNQMSFYSYEVGFAGEVVDQAAIVAMLTAIDESLTVTFNPADGDKGEAVGVTPTIVFSEAVKSAVTGNTLTTGELEEYITLKEVDFMGEYVTDIPFSAVIATDTDITITPDSNLGNDKIYEVKFDETKILSSAESGRVNGDNYARFGTIDAV